MTSNTGISSPLPVSRNSARPALAAVVVCLSLGLTLLATYSSRLVEVRQARSEFDTLVQRTAASMQQRLNVFNEVTAVVGALAENTGAGTRQGFDIFVRGVMTGLPGIQAIEFIPRVERDERTSFEQQARQEGLDGFTITQRDSEGKLVPAGDRAEYFPVLYIVPEEGNKAALGFDLTSNPIRLDALNKARNSRQAAASAGITLVQGSYGASAFLLFHPIYPKPGVPLKLRPGPDGLLGFSLGVFRTDLSLKVALEEAAFTCVRASIMDTTSSMNTPMLELSGECPRENAMLRVFSGSEVFETFRDLDLPQRTWRITFTSTPAFLAARLSWQPELTLGAGLVISLLLWLFLRENLRLTTQAQTLADEKERRAGELAVHLQQIEQAEYNAKRSTDILSGILVGIKAATFVMDPHTFVILEMNEVAEELFGISRQDWIGRNYGELLGRNLQDLGKDAALIQIGANIPEGFSGEFVLKRPDGKLVPISRTVLPVGSSSEDMLIEVLFDISSKKAMERQLGLGQKLESIGQLASGIAHEINTPIQYISGNLGFLTQAVKDLAGVVSRYEGLLRAAPCREALEEELTTIRTQARLDELLTEIPESIADSIAGVDRVATIVGAMKRFSHPEMGVKRLLDVNKAIESTLTISRNEWKYHSDLVKELDRSLPLLLCMPGDFNQAVLNVVVNAAHAVSEKFEATGERGVITVSTFQDDGFIAVRVADTGVGIPKENLDKVFDPFFTTKEVGKGTGQGLAIVHSVVDQHKGSISIDSVPGEGTTVTLRFPVPRQEEG